MGGRSVKYPFYSFIYGLFVLFVVLPVVFTLATAIFNNPSLQDNLSEIIQNTLPLLLKSVLIAAMIAAFSTAFGTLLGFLLYKTNVRFKRFYKVALLIPLFISPYILAVAWKDFFFLSFGNTSILTSYTGLIFVLTLVFTPLSMLITGSALNNISASLEESALVLTGFRKMVFKILLPLIKPALFTSFVLVFIFSISEFSVPSIFGIRVFTTEIFTQFSAFYKHSLAVLQAGLLILICVFLLYTDRKQLAEASFLSLGGKGIKTRIYSLKKGYVLSGFFVTGWFLISVVFPFTVLILQAFKNGTSQFVRAFSLIKPAIGNSVLLALTGALITVIIGFTAAYFTEREGKRSFNGFLLFIFAVPSSIFGISLIKFYNQPALNFIYSGFAIIVIGYVGKFSFIAAKLIENALKQIPVSLEEAARIQGTGFYKRIQRIVFPIVLPAVIIAFIIIFIFDLGELATTIMVYPPGTEIMPVKVFTIMANAPQSLTSSMTLIVLFVTLLMVGLLVLFAGKLIKKHPYVDH